MELQKPRRAELARFVAAPAVPSTELASRMSPQSVARTPIGDAKALGQDAGWFIAGCDLGAHGGRGAGVLVQGYQHGFTPWIDCKDSINSFKTARAMKSG